MPLRTWILVVVILKAAVQQSIANFTFKTKNHFLEKQVEEFYDNLGTDYEIDNRLNSSYLTHIDNLISKKIEKLHHLNQQKTELFNTLAHFEISCNRMMSATRSGNIVIIGLRYVPSWKEVVSQLMHLTKFLGIEYDDRQVKGYSQSQLVLKPGFSRIVLTLKKFTTKQEYLIKFKNAIGEQDKYLADKYIALRMRKLTNVPHLEDCLIYIQDDIDKTTKIVFGALKKFQRQYPKYLNCYIKDSRVYYKLNNKLRPSMVDKLEDVAKVQKAVLEMVNPLSTPGKRVKFFRSGTKFPWEEFKANRSKLNPPTCSYGG